MQIMLQLHVTPEEFDTILAGLRLWQRPEAHIADVDGALADIAQENGDPLTNEQIDALCERLNGAAVAVLE